MKIVTSVSEMAALSTRFRSEGARIGLVPTMGYLHDGHLSLVRSCKRASDVTVVSIFVNPVQFGPNEDFSTYPRDLESDCELCREEGVTVVFNPDASAMYSEDRSVSVIEDTLSNGLCGASRPGHFAGVCTVVAKLFNIVQPDMAIFGQKDAQQLAVIRRMVRDLNFQIEIVGAPIVREPDGLAMSSRNVYLSTGDREQALGLSRVLQFADEKVGEGMRDAAALKAAMMAFLLRDYPGVSIEYMAIVDAEKLVPRITVAGKTLLAIAARVGQTRLIDNLILDSARQEKS